MKGRTRFTAFLEEINASPRFNALQQAVDETIIAAYGNTLVSVVEIVVIKNEADRKTPNNKSRQLITWSSPLFLCIAFYQTLIDIAPDKQQRLFLQITRFVNTFSSHASHSIPPLFI